MNLLAVVKAVLLILRAAAVVILICDAWAMKKEYEKENLVGVVYWGFMTLIFAVMLL